MNSVWSLKFAPLFSGRIRVVSTSRNTKEENSTDTTTMRPTRTGWPRSDSSKTSTASPNLVVFSLQ